jgi:hypothetical protein
MNIGLSARPVTSEGTHIERKSRAVMLEAALRDVAVPRGRNP